MDGPQLVFNDSYLGAGSSTITHMYMTLVKSILAFRSHSVSECLRKFNCFSKIEHHARLLFHDQSFVQTCDRTSVLMVGCFPHLALHCVASCDDGGDDGVFRGNCANVSSPMNYFN